MSGGANGRLCVWDLDAGKELWSTETGPAPVLTLAILPGGEQFAAGLGSWATPGEVRVWNVRSGQNTFTLRGMGRECTGVAVDPTTGAVAACSHEGVIRVWGLGTGPDDRLARLLENLAAQSAAAERRADWSAAAFHATRHADLTPHEPALRLRAAHLWRLAGRPERAALHAAAAYLQNPALPAAPSRLAAPVGPGRWRVDGDEIVQDVRAPNCWLMFGDPSWTDYDFEVEAQVVTGTEGCCVGFRMTSPDDLYAAAAGVYTNSAAGFWTVTGGRYAVLGQTTPRALRPGHWYLLRVEVRGDRFRLFLDGTEIRTGQGTQLPHGRVGLRSWNTTNRFRNIRVTDPEGRVLFEGLPYIPGGPAPPALPPVPALPVAPAPRPKS